MAIAAGTRLGQYEILNQIGAGGMGEVYRANDLKLRREVALKVLPEAFAHSPERLARFRREAQLLAALNHTNIAAIYGLEQSGNVHFLVLELVEGETLRDRIERAGPVPVEEALEICKQITAALEAAHEKTIVHRDLKPANIKLTPEGQVKVLDFGLAKAFADEGAGSNPSESPTLSAVADSVPRWARNGRELFYSNGNKMMVVDIQTQPTFTAGKPRLLFEGQFAGGGDVAPDGQRFLMVQAVEPEQPATQINIVLNWFEELKRKVPVK